MSVRGMHNDKNTSLGHMVIEDFALSVVHGSFASAAIHKSRPSMGLIIDCRLTKQ